jgi:prepilin-type N-terminal cleavage/methylation domain-containing protein
LERDTPWDARRRSDAGFTLIELVVTVSILAIGVVGVMSALGSGITASRTDHQVTDRDRVLLAYSAEVAALEYESCADAALPYESLGPKSVADALPVGWSAKVATVETWTGVAGAAEFGDACADPDPGLQRITLVVTSDTGDTATTTILKRRS